jgi:hypothetical protein
MAKLKPNQLAETTELPESTGQQSAYGYLIRSRYVKFDNDVLHIEKKFSDNQKTAAYRIDFSDFYLPPNKLHPKVTIFKDRPDFAKVVVAVVDAYLLRQQYTKSTAHTAKAAAMTVLRFLEYCWINEIYHLKNVTREFFDKFLSSYAKGGWTFVLELERRAAAIDLRTLPLARRKGKLQYAATELLRAMGTNVYESQVSFEYRRGDSYGSLRSSTRESGASASSITQVIAQLNNLVEIPRDIRAPLLAHPNPYEYAVSVNATPESRTENFEPRKLAALVAEAYRWVSVYGDAIIELARIAFGELQPSELDAPDEARLFLLLDSPERSQLEQLIGTRIKSVRRVGDWNGGIGLVGAMRTLLSACFVILAIFNARRKDEIQSRSIGVFADAFKCVDMELSLFQCLFYCEKTSHDYIPFYVNEISFKALKICSALSQVAWDVAARQGGTPSTGSALKIFCMPPPGGEDSPTWYEYSSDPGIELLCERATGEKGSIVPNAHMFRRAYAVVFTYRYENEDLYALSQQLDHKDLNMTLHYVLEGEGRVIAHHAATLWGDGGRTKKERANRSKELAKEVEGYGKVKLHDDVLEIITGHTHVAGAFPKLIQRFVRVMYGRIKYDDASLKEAAAGVTKILIGRGHNVVPFVHGNCNAGPPRPSARCFKDGRLAREIASPPVCGSCPYHTMKDMHLKAVRDDLQMQKIEIAKRNEGSLMVKRELEMLSITEKLVNFYESRQNKSIDSAGG